MTVLGNLKYDVTAAEPPTGGGARSFLSAGTDLWIAASTMPDEEEMVLDAFRELRDEYPELKLMIAPRHPERFDGVERTLMARVIRRT